MPGSRAGAAKPWQDAGGAAGVAAQRGGDVAVAVGVQDADGQGGAGWPWRGSGDDLGATAAVALLSPAEGLDPPRDGSSAATGSEPPGNPAPAVLAVVAGGYRAVTAVVPAR
jgi:hypothetical protein